MLHIVVYLDQNFLSNMTKARIGRISDELETKFWNSVFHDLKKAVLSDKIACPELGLQLNEAQFDNRIEEGIRETIDNLSWGLRFHPYIEILEAQIEDAAKRFLGKELENKASWVKIFQSDPQANIDSRMHVVRGIKTRINVHLSLPEEAVNHDRQLKEGFVNVSQKLLEQCDYNGPADLPKAIIDSKKSCISGAMGSIAWNHIIAKLQTGTELEQIMALNRFNELTKLWDKLRSIGMDINDQETVMRFAKSKELLNIPFIDIFSSIYAAIATHYPRRRMQKGDLYDAPILATVLPHCDIVTTDEFMKKILVEILHFGKKYKVCVLSAKTSDRRTLQNLVRKLIDCS